MWKIWLGSITAIQMIFLFIGATSAAEKDPKDFVLTYVENFAEWELICGHFGNVEDQDCNLRYTSVYSPRPNFKAAVFFLESDGDRFLFDMHHEFFSVHLFNSMKDGADLQISLAHCVTGRCELEGHELLQFIGSLKEGRDVTSHILDYGITPQDIVIPSEGFIEGYENLRQELAKRGKGHLIENLSNLTLIGNHWAESKRPCNHL